MNDNPTRQRRQISDNSRIISDNSCYKSKLRPRDLFFRITNPDTHCVGIANPDEH